MRIGLVALSGVRVRDRELAALGVTLPGFIRRGKVIASLPSLGLLTVAGWTPPGHEVEYLEWDEVPEVLPSYDLVAISALSARIFRAYELADRFRAAGTQVVMGGLHVSALPEEALQHADAVVINGAERIWPQVVEDAAQGRMKGRYEGASDRLFQGTKDPLPDFSLLQGRAYNRVTIQTSRGCPRRCHFCAASLRITRSYQQKPVDQVMREIREARRFFRQPFFELADDNTFLDRRWSWEFLKALTREEIHYFTETDLTVAEDPALCRALAESGCRQVLVGLESPRVGDLEGLDPAQWKRNRAESYERAIHRLQSAGVSVNGCFILGLDGQTPEVFPEILDFVRRSGLAEVQYTVMTPFPGTPLTAQLEQEGRLLYPGGWDRCTLFDVMFQPRDMTVEELEKGMRWLFRETYSHSETRRRQREFLRQAPSSGERRRSREG